MADTAANPRARTLASTLRRARTTAGYGVRELARTLNLSHATISQWETGKRVPALDDLTAMLTAIGLTGEAAAPILELAAERHRTPTAPGRSPYLDGVLECERGAAEIIEWSPLAIPELLQTAAYAREVIGTDDALTRADVQARVDLRLSRRAALAPGAQYTALIGEWALRQEIGGVAVQVEQLTLLAKGWLTARVVPIGAGWHPGLTGPFTLYHFADADSIAYLPHHFVYDERAVTEYQVAATRVRRAALSEGASVEFINNVIKKLEKAAARRSR